MAGPIEAIQVKAGIDRFDKYGYRNTLNSLAGGDISNYEKILNLPYNEIFVKLLMNKDEAAYQKRLRELQQP